MCLKIASMHLKNASICLKKLKHKSPKRTSGVMWIHADLWPFSCGSVQLSGLSSAD